MPKKIIAYFGSWSVYWPGNGKFDIEKIDPTLCTHLIYAFVGLSGNDIRIIDPWQDLPDNYGKNGFARFNALRDRNPRLKTMVAIGGWNEGSAVFSQMASSRASREEFADNAVKFLKKYKFDGLDVDWEYPGQRDGSSADVKNFSLLLKTLRTRFDHYGLLLSAAVAAAESSASKSYDIPRIARCLDFINLMNYDYCGWETYTGIHAPLYAGSNEGNKGFNVHASVEYWVNQGAPRGKLIMGIPTYGRSFTLANPRSTGVGAPATGKGRCGPYTNEAGRMGYNEICEKLHMENWTVEYDSERIGYYAYKGDQWIGYDDVKSVKKKIKYINDKHLGGAMIWSIDTDNFSDGRYSILNTIKFS